MCCVSMPVGAAADADSVWHSLWCEVGPRLVPDAAGTRYAFGLVWSARVSVRYSTLGSG
jgi:hypothetical protein